MPILGEICHADQIYMPFFGTIADRNHRKKSIAQKHIQIDDMLRSGFFPKTALGEGPMFWIFPGFASFFRTKALFKRTGLTGRFVDLEHFLCRVH